MAVNAAVRPGSRVSSGHTASAVLTCAAAAAPNTSGEDAESVDEAASSRAAPCQRNSVRVTDATKATRAAQPSRRTEAFL
mmetsp:Transcript_3591/g.13236  ORF Transcript_3591/g.13236 Transcript_3591/m.13236 type:complete len:80 (-) Transcript_3591:969-1208(-)